MFQPNLRMIDAKGLDGRKLARQCRDLGANAILANAGGIVAWYPTRLPYHWKNPLLRSDYVGDLTSEAARLGMRVLLRMDWSCLKPAIARRHRDWLALDAAGRPRIEYAGTPDPLWRTCPNRPYWQTHAFAELVELMRRYRFDGFFFNAWDLPDCHCPECRRACHQALGRPLPARVDWASPFGKAYQGWRATHHAAFTRALNARIKRVNPRMLLTVDFHLTNDHPHHLAWAGWDGAQLADAVDMVTVEAFNFLGRPRPHWPWWAAEEAQMIRSFPAGKPGIVLLSGSERGHGRRPAAPPAAIATDILDIVGYGAHPCVAVTGDLRQDDPRVVDITRRVYRRLADADRGLAARPKPPADLALVYSQRTLDLYGGAGSREKALFHYRGWYAMLAGIHAAFTVVHDGVLASFLAGPGRVRTLVLPNCAVLSDGDCRAVDAWVRRGGRLVATFETSRWDGRGTLRRGFGLRSLPRRPGRVVAFPGTWFEARGRDRCWAIAPILPVAGEFLLTTGGGTGSLRLLDWRFNNKPEWAVPTRRTNQHGLYERRFGKGRVRYLPWTPDKLLHTTESDAIRALLRRVISF
jgi:hypothetical protein